DILPTLVRHFGEPFADSSCIPTYYVSKLTREYVTVALNGDGADELFAGYGRYFAIVLSQWLASITQLLPEKHYQWLVNKIPAKDDQRDFLFRTRRFLTGLGISTDKRYKQWLSSFTEEQLARVVKPDYLNSINTANNSDVILALFNNATKKDVIRNLLAVDLQSYLPGDLLVKMDITSMANSLEARSPFLDHKVVEFAWALNSNMKLRGATSKYILKKTFGDILPKRILNRKKTGFGVPVRRWLKEDLQKFTYDVLLDSNAFSSIYFDREYIQCMLDEHSQGSVNHDKSLWALLMLELWYKHCFKGN
ncbi:asparagine synthetase B family protein, partial [Candidatus Omnitrophota bacterium]